MQHPDLRLPVCRHLFIDGCLITFFGVWLITSARTEEGADAKPETGGRSRTAPSDLREVLTAAESPQVQIQVEEDLQAPPDQPAALEGSVGRVRAKSVGMEATAPGTARSDPGTARRPCRRRPPSRGRQHGCIPAMEIDSPGMERASQAADSQLVPMPRKRRRRRFTSFLGLLGCAGGGQAALFIHDPAAGEDEEYDDEPLPPLSEPPPAELSVPVTRRWSRSRSGADNDPTRTPLSPQMKGLTVDEGDACAEPALTAPTAQIAAVIDGLAMPAPEAAAGGSGRLSHSGRPSGAEGDGPASADGGGEYRI